MKVRLDSGSVIDLGATEETPTISLTDYSRRVTDDFGVTTVVPRAFSRRMSVRMMLPTTSVDAVQRQLVDVRAAEVDWLADDTLAWLQVRGFYKDFELNLASASTSYCTLNVEGLAQTEVVADNGADPAIAGRTSTLRLLQPIDVTDASLTSSTVLENDAASWGAGTTYAKGARVIRAHRVYESLVAGNVGKDPSTSPAAWLDTGPTNRWAMFDQALGTATTSGKSIAVTLAAGSPRAIAVLDVVASSVRVQANGYDRTIVPALGSALFLDLPANAGAITVTATAANQVAIGTLLVGTIVGLGSTEAAPTAGITDYSRKETDDFGETTVVPRAFAKKMSVRSLISTDAVDRVANRIASVRARPCLWIADDALETVTIYGFFKDFSIEVGRASSKLALSVEGLSKALPLPKPPPEGPNIVAQGSADGVNWHDGLQTGDVYMRLSTDYGATFGTPVKIAGEDATPGEDGSYQQQIFKRSPTRPATPTGGGIPAGWSDGVPDGTDLIWLSVQYQRNGIALGPWSLPAQIKGDRGGSAVTIVPHSATVIVEGNNVRGTAGTGWGVEAAHTKESFIRGAAAQWTLPAVHGDNIMAGLSQSNDTTSNSYESVTFAIFRQDNGRTDARVSGNVISGGPDASAESRFAVQYDYGTGVVSFIINGTVFCTFNWGKHDDPLFFRAALASIDPRITDLTLLPSAATGRDGVGLPGEDGKDGQTFYPYFAYADSPDGTVNFTTLNPGARTYEGRKFGLTPFEPGNPAEYTWRPYYGPPFGMDVRGNCSVAGRNVTKAGGNGGAWDSDAYSTSGYTGGAIATARSRDGSSSIMFGLNSDPRTDASYASLDYAWYLRGDGYASFYESGNPVNNDAPGAGPGYGQGKFDVVYKNGTVRYLYNDVVCREVDAGVGRTFYFDSSFLTPGGALTDIDFAPLGADGAGSFTLVNIANCAFPLPNAVIKASGGNDWNGKARTVESGKGTGQLTASMPRNSFIGLSSNPAASLSYDTIGYGLHNSSDGYFYVFINQNAVWNSGQIGARPYAPIRGTVTHDGKKARFSVEGYGEVFVYDSPDGNNLFGTFAIGEVGQQISNIAYSPGGASGTDGFILDTEHTEFLVPVFASGAAKPSWVGAQGTIKLTKGGARITDGVSYGLRSADKLASLSLAGDVFSFAGITADVGSFVIQASFAGQLYERTITIKKVYDGNSAFRGSATFNQQVGGGSASLVATATAVPSSNGMRLSAVANYAPFNTAVGTYRARLHLYWENQTDGGGVQYLGYQDGSTASTVNRGTASEPDYAMTPGTVSASFNFAGFPADKRIAFYVNIERIAGNISVQVTGSAQLDTV